MPSKSLQTFIDTCLLDTMMNIYTVSSFTIVNNGLMLDGSGSADRLNGRFKSDIVWGNGGNDFMRGGGARDLLTGGAGDDLVYGDKGDDRIEGWGDEDQIYGGDGKDELYGGAGDDTLFGGSGNDYLCAGSGKDQLNGGTGADVFVFRPDLGDTASESVYEDFTLGEDQLKIEGYLLPDGFAKSMIQVDLDGVLYIATVAEHRLTFETLGVEDINGLFNSITVI